LSASCLQTCSCKTKTRIHQSTTDDLKEPAI
jgi:hypothetical protein